jgi:ferredoxin
MDKGAVARKSCSVACIGCSKCEKECAYDAITMADNLAFIDSDKCKLCRKCVSVCPTNAIIELNFPPRKITVTEPVKVVAEKVKPDVSATNVTEIKPESSEN